MTLEPTRLEKLDDSLDGEVKSVAILRERLASLTSRPDISDENAKNERREGDEREAVKHAGEVLDAYSAWLSDTSKDFTAERQDAAEGEVQDIIDEVLFRQRYISNQLSLLSLTQNQKQSTSRIDKLQRYNELKDVAQELMGLVAENRGVAVGRLYEDKEFGVSAED